MTTNPKHEGRQNKMAIHYLTADELEEMTGTPASTFRYWASIGEGPPSIKLGRRRVWKRDQVEKWLAKQEAMKST
jgi:predicted DNA-binding transcriptional regulator AlpA